MESISNKFRWILKFIWINRKLLLSLVFVVSVFYFYSLTKAPTNFPLDAPVTIKEGISAASASRTLEEANIVRSNTFLYVVLVMGFDPASIKSGVYTFTEKMSVFEVASRITSIAPPSELTSVTLPEGYTAQEFASLTKKVLPEFDTNVFVKLAVDDEGFIFPDTYFVPKNFSENEFHILLKNSYLKKTADIRDELNNYFLTEYEVITLASILERESNTTESMGVVAGILLARLQMGMPLQVDASMEYILNKPLQNLTADDLEIDSPYNTYMYKGLPPTPIGNPGIAAIKAVLHPKITNYLYYITDSDGVFHYSETFAEHKDNIVRYLR